jgi:hypothetical protein
MKKLHLLFVLIFSILLLTTQGQNVVVIIIDGARYTETFGDSNRTYIPVMDSLSTFGTYIDKFYNDSMTYTSRALPALWTGTWTAVKDTFYNGAWTQYTKVPSIFEYYRKQKPASLNQCYYILKYVSSLWLPSFHPNYGPNYWPTFYSIGEFDREVLNEALSIMTNHHPQHTWIYFANVDSRGHSGIWNDYTRAIQIADSLVGETWQFIQNDPFYKNNTYLFVTNDHGRHDDAHGGFQNHGCGCDGCRHIMFLSMGPTVKQNQVTLITRYIPDLSVTVANILNVIPEFATGNNMIELFDSNQLDLKNDFQSSEFKILNNYPNPFNSETTIQFEIENTEQVLIEIFSLMGKKIETIMNRELPKGKHKIKYIASKLPSGVYFIRIQTELVHYSKKIALLK